ncbi:MAG: T9SS type A sorting domain-containing protein [Bacteroidales bacterium]|jgi:hypothetical protein|nr:T9SS type A sorting domain-containing protein [Bacteroidales bacterium]
MKKAMLFLCALVLGLSINAQQFTNSGFETWSGNSPQAWNTLGFMGFNLCEVSKTTEAHNGNFAIKIAPAMLPDMLISALGMTESFAVPGILTNATINVAYLMEMLSDTTSDLDIMQEEMLTNLLTNGLQISSKPSEITGHYMFNQVEGSTDVFALIALVVSQTEEQRRIVGIGAFTPIDFDMGGGFLKNTSSYESFSMPIEYMFDIPATELIFLALVISDGMTSSFSNLYLDDLNVVYNSGLEALSFDNDVVAYPNPTSGEFKLKGAEGCKVRVCDVLGREVLNLDQYNGQTVKIEQKGVYFLNIDNRETQKLIVK